MCFETANKFMSHFKCNRVVISCAKWIRSGLKEIRAVNREGWGGLELLLMVVHEEEEE